MNVTSREGFERAWNRELGDPERREEGMVDTVWDAIMDSGIWWGWLIVYGERDKTVNSAPGTVPLLSTDTPLAASRWTRTVITPPCRDPTRTPTLWPRQASSPSRHGPPFSACTRSFPPASR
ncbi:hypothetical protein [Streptomyces sp. NPDC001774]